VTAILLVAALIVDVTLLFVAASTAGFSGRFGPLRVRLHDPSTLLVLTALVAGTLVAVTWRGRARGWALASVVLAVTTAGVALTREAQWIFPLGDTAVLEMYVRDALAGRLVVGPYSRFGWHHPGPIYFYVIAPLYRFGGGHANALSVGAAFVTISSIALLAWAAARSLGSRTSAAILASVALYLWRIPDLATSAWNPHVVVLPTLVLIVAAAAMAGGDLVMAPLSVGLASFIVQTDVALVPLAATMVAASAAGCLVRTWHSERLATRRWFKGAAWLAAAVWLVPVSEEIAHTPGNMTLLWRFFVNGAGQGQNVGTAAIAWASMLSSPLTRSLSLATGGTFEASSAGVAIVLALGQLIAVGGVLVWARRSHPALSRLAAAGVLTSLVALWSATRIVDHIMDHELFWLGGIGALNLGIVLAAMVAAPVSREARQASLDGPLAALVHGALIAIVVSVCCDQLNRAREGHLPVTLGSPAASRFSDSIRRYVDEQRVNKPLVRIGQDVWGLAAGALLELDRAGVPFAVERSWMPMFPASFGESGEEDAELVFGNYDEHLRQMERPGSVFVTSTATVYVDGTPVAGRH